MNNIEQKKMLAILASPRKNGNAAKMLDIAKEKARDMGYEVTSIDIYDKDIAYCKGCMYCRSSGKCVIKDDISEVCIALAESDLTVISSPTYFANVPAPLKNMFDRLVYTVMDDNTNGIPKKKLSSKQKYLLMTTCNTPYPFNVLFGQSTGCLKAMDEVMHVSGMKCVGKIAFAGTKGKKQIPDVIRKKIIKSILKCR